MFIIIIIIRPYFQPSLLLRAFVRVDKLRLTVSWRLLEACDLLPRSLSKDEKISWGHAVADKVRTGARCRHGNLTGVKTLIEKPGNYLSKSSHCSLSQIWLNVYFCVSLTQLQGQGDIGDPVVTESGLFLHVDFALASQVWLHLVRK